MELSPSRPVLERLADTLWAERHVVELLLYKLTAARLFLAADERRFVPVALDEVERVMGLLRDAEERRTDAIAETALELALPVEDLTLTELANASPEPLRSVFLDHRKGFLTLAAEIEETAAMNRRLASEALTSVQQALDTLAGPPATTTYTAAGRQLVAAPTPLRLDQVM